MVIGEGAYLNIPRVEGSRLDDGRGGPWPAEESDEVDDDRLRESSGKVRYPLFMPIPDGSK